MDALYSLLKTIFIILFIGGLLLVLAMILRYSVISPFLTRGAAKRLRHPDAQGIASIVGFTPDPELFRFYQEWPYLEKTEYFLVDVTNSGHNKATDLLHSLHQIDGDNRAIWFIGGFEALGKVDVREMLRGCGRHGVPIATDMNKGVYFLQADGSIVLYSPNIAGGHVKVAASIGELMGFQVAEYEEIHPEDEDA